MGRSAATLRRVSRVIAALAVVIPAVLAFTGTVEGWPLPALLFGGLATAGGLGLWANWHLGTAHHDRLGHVALGRGLQLREPPDPGRGTRAGAFTLQAHRAHRRNRGLPPDDTERADPELLDDVLPSGTRWCGLLATGTHDWRPLRLELVQISRKSGGRSGGRVRHAWYVCVTHRIDVEGELHVRRGAMLPFHVHRRDLPEQRTGDDAFDAVHQVRADDAGARLLTPATAARWERTVGHARVSLRGGWLGLAHETRDPTQTEAAARSLLEAVEALADELRRRGS